jgi:hypothetical protein
MHPRISFLLLFIWLSPLAALLHAAEKPILPTDWNAKAAADHVLAGLFNVSGSSVKGAHDSDLLLVGDRAYVISMANDDRPGENPRWPFVYATISVVNPKERRVEKIVPIARSEEQFKNVTLPVGSCFVPRLVRRDETKLRCFFASEEPDRRQSQTWYRDFDIATMTCEPEIHRAKLKTAAGVFDMQPQVLYDDAVTHGFTREPKQHGLYQIDSFKQFDGKNYAVVNNFATGQNSLAVLNKKMDTFEVLGQFNEPVTLKLTEAAINRLPDGTWLAICRQDAGNKNYTFATSTDGRTWAPNEHRDLVPNGTNSKPSFNRFGDVYYLGWQESTRVKGVSRSVFNIEVSRDGKKWERKYRFETPKSFQYPVFREHNGKVYLTVTQGTTNRGGKERIMFGVLE